MDSLNKRNRCGKTIQSGLNLK